MSKLFKIYYDAEFTGLHKNTTLISIGLVAEDGHYFYAEFTDYDASQCDEWIQNNVISNLILTDYDDNTNITMNKNIFIKGNRNYINNVLNLWLYWLYTNKGKQIQLYSDCYAYDWVLFNDLTCKDGRAINLPDYIYYIPMDLSTALQLKGYDPDVSREEFARDKNGNISPMRIRHTQQIDENNKHNALWDAYVCKVCFDKLK